MLRTSPRGAVILLLAGLVLGLLALPAAAQRPAHEYVIGPRDVVQVTVWGQADLTKDYPVDQDGYVAFPLLGRVKAAGSSTGELAGVLTERLGKDYLVNPQVS